MVTATNNYLGAFNHYQNQFERNAKKIVSLNDRLDSYAKDPDFYKERKIAAIAVIVGIVAIAALAATCITIIGTPLACIAASLPLLGLLPFTEYIPDLFASREKDLATVDQLTIEQPLLQAKKRELILDLQNRLAACNLTLSFKGFNAGAWESVHEVLNIDPIPDYSGTEEQRAIFEAHRLRLQQITDDLTQQFHQIKSKQ